MIISDGFSNPIFGHVFSSVQAVYPADTMTKRLNSLESRLLLQTTEENIEDPVFISDFGALIHASPFKSPIKWPPKRTSLAAAARAKASQVKKVLPYESKSPSNFQSPRLKSFNSMKSMGSEKTPKNGILKKGTRSRFASPERSNTYQSEGSIMSRVTIVE